MDSLLYGSANVSTSAVPTMTELVTAPPVITIGTRSEKSNKKYQHICSDQESVFLPIEIMAEILCRLDAKALLKFKSVCKQWRALIEDPNFVKQHASRAPVLRHYQDDVDITSPQIQVISTSDGLILERVIDNSFERKYRVRNPTMRRVFDLPDPHEETVTMDISYVPSSGCYKVVSLHREKDKALTVGVDVLTLGSVVDEPIWRFLDVTPLRNLHKRYGSLTINCLKGVVHFYPKSGLRSKDFEVVSLDMDKECFTSTTVPSSFLSGSQTDVHIIGYKCHRNQWHLSLGEIVKDELRLLVLEDYKQGKWAEKNITIPLTFLRENSNMKSAEPHRASPWYVWFSMNGKTKRYSIQSQQMNKERRPRGKKKSFVAKGTLVTFKGMRPKED